MDGKKTNLTDPMTFVGMNDISNVDFRLNKKGFKLGDFDCEADLDCQRMGSGNGANRLIMSTKIDQIGWVNLKLANKGYIDRSNEDEVAANDEAKLVFDLGKFSKEVHTDLSASLEYDLCAKAAALNVGFLNDVGLAEKNPRTTGSPRASARSSRPPSPSATPRSRRLRQRRAQAQALLPPRVRRRHRRRVPPGQGARREGRGVPRRVQALRALLQGRRRQGQDHLREVLDDGLRLNHPRDARVAGETEVNNVLQKKKGRRRRLDARAVGWASAARPHADAPPRRRARGAR